MKPDNAMEFDVSPDLCGYWLYKAMDMIFNKLEHPRNKINLILKVSSQGMGEACRIGYLTDIHSTIDFDYREDEWSLAGYYFTEDLKTVEAVVWSKGA